MTYAAAAAGLLVLGLAAPASAAGSPVALPAPGAVCDPVKPGCGGVQPGAVLDVGFEFAPGVQGICTMNVLFGGADGARYVSTAGHCASVAPGRPIGEGQELSWAPGEGVAVLDGRGQRFGEWAYASVASAQGRDFGLIRLDAGVAANPQVLGIGGPTGVNNDVTTERTTMRFTGQGVVASDADPTRTATALGGLDDPDVVRATAAVTPGDSGAPFLTSDGRIVGVLSLTPTDGSSDTAVIPRTGPQVARASEVLGTSLRLITASR